MESLVSRESSFFFGTLVLLAACFVLLWGTLFPVLSGLMTGNKVTIDAPWYNSVAVPIGLFLLFLSGVGPLLPWRATSLKSLRRNFVLPLIAMLVTVFVCVALGVRPWKDGVFDQSVFYAIVAFALAAGVIDSDSARSSCAGRW
jgi:cytochrome c-type biogenesis protein CcmF